MSFFESLTLLPEDPVFGLPQIVASDPRPNKVNLGIGVYFDEEGKLGVLSTVREAEKIIQEKNLTKNYQAITGDPTFAHEGASLLFGQDYQQKLDGRIFLVQTLGGTGALRVGAELLAQENCRLAFVSEPTWPNHRSILQRSGLKVHSYPYYDNHHHRLNFSAMCDAVKKMPPGSIVLLHCCCHNPTGNDLSLEQWRELAVLLKQGRLFPFVDFAYQGFAEGLEEDAKPLQCLLAEGLEFIVASSYSKNFGLYGERVGLLTVVCNKPEVVPRVASQTKQLIRGTYSAPPLHGQRIVTTILQSEPLRNRWKEEVEGMRNRLHTMRQLLIEKLQERTNKHDFSFLQHQKGMFSFCGLNHQHVEILRKDFAIYTPDNGRMNVAGLNRKNIDYVADALVNVLEK